MSRQRRTEIDLVVGAYTSEWWPVKYENNAYVHVPEKPSYRKYLVKRVTAVKPHTDPWYAARGYMARDSVVVDKEELMAVTLTVKNSGSIVRHEQAAELEKAGYYGPIGGGEARVLKSLFAGLNMPDLVKHAWAMVDAEVWVRHTARQLRAWAWRGQTPPAPGKRGTKKLQNCYVFKSPMEGVHFSKFIKLARMYRDDSKQLRKAVEALLANPDAAKEIEMLDTLEILAGMRGM